MKARALEEYVDLITVRLSSIWSHPTLIPWTRWHQAVSIARYTSFKIVPERDAGCENYRDIRHVSQFHEITFTPEITLGDAPTKQVWNYRTRPSSLRACISSGIPRLCVLLEVDWISDMTNPVTVRISIKSSINDPYDEDGQDSLGPHTELNLGAAEVAYFRALRFWCTFPKPIAWYDISLPQACSVSLVFLAVMTSYKCVVQAHVRAYWYVQWT